MMKRKVFLLTGAAVMLLGACQDNTVLCEYGLTDAGTAAIEFGNYVGGLTRASRGTGASFVPGDEMGVYGFQMIDGDTARLFNNQLVEYTAAGKWTYSPAKYWDSGSGYDFYAAYPYGAGYTFDIDERKFSLASFTVDDVTAQQVDLMLGQRVLNARPYNTVNFVFNHILSNVNFYAKAAKEFNATGISSVTVLKFDVTGLYSKGSFEQTGWNGDVFNGKWSADKTSVYDMPEVKNVDYTIGSTGAVSLIEDLLLLPQDISNDALVNITYKLNYSNGDESVFRRSFPLNRIVGYKVSTPAAKTAIASWNPNYRYKYIISINPSITENGGTHLPIINIYTGGGPGGGGTEYDIIYPAGGGGPGGYGPDGWGIDTDMDGEPDADIIWTDVDGDGNLEAVPDLDGDGVPDDTDGDGIPDVIWVDKDGDGIADAELEWNPDEDDEPEIPVRQVMIEFSAEVTDWSDEYIAEQVMSSDAL